MSKRRNDNYSLSLIFKLLAEYGLYSRIILKIDKNFIS